MARLVAAIPQVVSLTARPMTLIGGLAVLARLSVPHRATTDLDTANRVERGQTPTLELILGQPGARPADAAGVLLPTPRGAVKVDVIDIGSWQTHPVPSDPNDALYALAHAWAVDTAEEMQLAVEQGDEVVAQATVPVATPAALVAMKLQSAMNRGGDKEATDLLDIVTLLRDPACGPVALRGLQQAPEELTHAAIVHARHWFRTGAAGSLRSIHRIEEGRAIDLEAVRDAGELLTAALAR